MKQRKRPPFTPSQAISQCPLDCHCRRQFSPVLVGPQEGRPDHNSSSINSLPTADSSLSLSLRRHRRPTMNPMTQSRIISAHV
jgi:hypothetical protein